jgi:hypothetical protein
MPTSSIELLKKSVQNMTQNNIVRLLVDIILRDLTNIRDFSEKETYYNGDIVYKFDIVENKHNLYKCKNDRVIGEFNINDWDIYEVSGSNINTVILQSEFTSESDGITKCEINHDAFNPDLDFLIVFHSVRGLLKPSLYTINDDKRTITLSFGLYKGESLFYLILKNIENNEGNQRLTDFLEEMQVKIDSFKEFVESSQHVFLENYTYITQENTTNVPIGIPEYNSDLDILVVNYKNNPLDENINWKLNTNKISIDLIDWEYPPEVGKYFKFTVIKRMRIDLNGLNNDARLLMNDSIYNEKLGTDVKIGSLAASKTIVKTDIISVTNEIKDELDSLKLADEQNYNDYLQFKSENDLSQYKGIVTVVDENDMPTTKQFKRKSDDTLAIEIIASNPDINGFYQTVIKKFYDADGTTVYKTITYTLTFRENGIINTSDYIIELTGGE